MFYSFVPKTQTDEVLPFPRHPFCLKALIDEDDDIFRRPEGAAALLNEQSAARPAA